jgi:ribosomal protein L29
VKVTRPLPGDALAGAALVGARVVDPDEVREMWACRDGYLTGGDIARAAGVSWRKARRAVEDYCARFENARSTGDGAHLTFETTEDIPNPKETSRADMAVAIARVLGIGRFAVREKLRARQAARPEAKEEKVWMPAQNHPWVLGDRGRSFVNGSGGIVATLTCHCGATQDVRFRNLCDADVMDRKFKDKGWLLNPARCPDHARSKRQERNDVSKPNHANAQANARMFGMLTAHFDPEAGTYATDWSDERVAKETGLAPEYVRTVRDEALGPLREPPEVRQLREDIATVEALLAEEEGRIRSVRDMVEGLKIKAAELSKKFAA